jgi:hypothetical protein
VKTLSPTTDPAPVRDLVQELFDDFTKGFDPEVVSSTLPSYAEVLGENAELRRRLHDADRRQLETEERGVERRSGPRRWVDSYVEVSGVGQLSPRLRLTEDGETSERFPRAAVTGGLRGERPVSGPYEPQGFPYSGGDFL